MEMKIMKKIILLLAVIFMLGSCADMDDTHRDFLGNGEQIYVGKADSLTVYGGYERAKIMGLMHYAKTAERCVIRWTIEGKGDSVTIPASQWRAHNDTLSVVIEGLAEGTQRFFLQTYDAEGNKSLNVECSGTVYGEGHILTASPKIITRMVPQPDGIFLLWNMSEEAIGVEMRYDSNDGEKTMNIDAKEDTTFLQNWKLGGSVHTRTILVPEKGAIDTLYTAWTDMQFPEFVEFEVSKTKIKYMEWSNDAKTGYSGTYAGVFDGVIKAGGNQFHSGAGVGVPQHLTFDLGVNANLTRFELHARGDSGDTYYNWNPKKIQIWGIEQIDASSQVSVPSGDAGWENEARAKGWVLLSENTTNDPISNKLTLTNPGKARYIIIRTTEVYGAPSTGSGAYVILREVTLFANSILPVD